LERAIVSDNAAEPGTINTCNYRIEVAQVGERRLGAPGWPDNKTNSAILQGAQQGKRLLADGIANTAQQVCPLRLGAALRPNPPLGNERARVGQRRGRSPQDHDMIETRHLDLPVVAKMQCK